MKNCPYKITLSNKYIVGTAVLSVLVLLDSIAGLSATTTTQPHTTAATAQTDAAQRARSFVETVARDGLGILAHAERSDDDKRRDLRTLVEKNFDLEGIGQFVLGPGQTLNDAQKNRYQSLFEAMILRIYFDQLKSLVIRDFSIQSVSEPDDEKLVSLHSKVTSAQQSDPVDVQWVVAVSEHRPPKVVDVIVSNISLKIIQAREIRALLAREGSIDALLDRMAEKFGPGL